MEIIKEKNNPTVIHEEDGHGTRIFEIVIDKEEIIISQLSADPFFEEKLTIKTDTLLELINEVRSK